MNRVGESKRNPREQRVKKLGKIFIGLYKKNL